MSEKTSSQERIILITHALCNNHIFGLSNNELAKLVGTSEVNICRDINLLKQHKWIVRNDKGRWVLSPVFADMLRIIAVSYKEARLLLEKEEARYALAMQMGGQDE